MYTGDTLNIHLHLRGIMETIVENAIEKGYATSKSEVIRMALLKLDEELALSEESAYQTLSKEAMKDVWDNPKDEEASNFYLRGKK